MPYKEAISHTSYILEQLKQQNKGKPVYVEQFLFTDNTLDFSYNAQIADDEVDDYLENVSEILLSSTAGYGIWTYRNYLNNMIYNNGFVLKEEGWLIDGDVEFRIFNGSNVCHIAPNASISQIVSERRNQYDVVDTYIFSMDIAQCTEDSSVLITFGNESQTVEVSEKDTKIQVSFHKNEAFDLNITALSGEVCIDNVRMYSHLQEGHLYDENNQEMECIDSFRILNSELSNCFDL